MQSIRDCRIYVYALISLLLTLTACSGSGGGSTTSAAPPPGTSTPPTSTNTQPPPPSAGLLGTWAGVWSSSLSTAGGAMAMRIDLDTPQGPVMMQNSPCGIQSKLIANLNGSVLTGLLAYPGPGSFDVPIMATLTRNGDALTGSYATGASSKAGCGNDQGQWTLIRTPDHTLIEVAIPIQPALGALVGIPLAYAGSQAFDQNISGDFPLTVTFPTTTTVVLQTSTSRTEGQWSCAGRNCTLRVTQSTPPHRDPSVTYVCDWRVTVLPLAVGGPAVKGSIALTCGNVYGKQSRSATIALGMRLAGDGTLIFLHPQTGSEVDTEAQVLTQGQAGGVF